MKDIDRVTMEINESIDSALLSEDDFDTQRFLLSSQVYKVIAKYSKQIYLKLYSILFVLVFIVLLLGVWTHLNTKITTLTSQVEQLNEVITTQNITPTTKEISVINRIKKISDQYDFFKFLVSYKDEVFATSEPKNLNNYIRVVSHYYYNYPRIGLYTIMMPALDEMYKEYEARYDIRFIEPAPDRIIDSFEDKKAIVFDHLGIYAGHYYDLIPVDVLNTYIDLYLQM